MNINDGLEYELTWPSRLKRTGRIKSFRNISVGATRNAYDVVSAGPVKKAYKVSKPRTSKAAGKKIPDSQKKMSVVYAQDATSISLHTRANTMNGRLKGWGKKGWTKLSWPLTFISKKIGKPKKSTGKRVYRNLKFYLSLIILVGLAYIGAESYLDSWLVKGAFIGTLWFVTENIIKRR